MNEQKTKFYNQEKKPLLKPKPKMPFGTSSCQQLGFKTFSSLNETSFFVESTNEINVAMNPVENCSTSSNVKKTSQGFEPSNSATNKCHFCQRSNEISKIKMQEIEKKSTSDGELFEELETEHTYDTPPFYAVLPQRQESWEHGWKGDVIDDEEGSVSSFSVSGDDDFLSSDYYVIKEIIDTEESYLRDLEITINYIRKPLIEKQILEISKLETLFSNIDDLRDFSKTFLADLKLSAQEKASNDLNLGRVFLNHFPHMLEIFSIYCRNNKAANNLLQELKSDLKFQNYLRCLLKDVSKLKVNTFDLGAFIIVPVQRMLKYPLLLQELVKATKQPQPEEDVTYYREIFEATKVSEDVARAINEKKKRLEIVTKYREKVPMSRSKSDSSIKSSTIKQNIKNFTTRLSLKVTGQSKIIDEDFNELEQKYKSIEDSLKNFLLNLQNYYNKYNKVLMEEHQLAEDILSLFASDHTYGVTLIATSIHKIREQSFKHFQEEADRRVATPIEHFLNKTSGLHLLIRKRLDKLLDYENHLLSNIKKNQEAKEIFDALNQQLIDEIPKLCDFACDLLSSCLKVLMHLQKKLFEDIFKSQREAWMVFTELEMTEQPFTRQEIYERFNFRYPEILNGNKRLRLPKAQTQAIKEKLRSTYNEGELSITMEEYSSTSTHDISCSPNDIVRVLKTSHPQGCKGMWFCDNGNAQGFLPCTLLKPFRPVVAQKPNLIKKKLETSLSHLLPRWKSTSKEPFSRSQSQDVETKMQDDTNSLPRPFRPLVPQKPKLIKRNLKTSLPHPLPRRIPTSKEPFSRSQSQDVETEMLDGTEYKQISSPNFRQKMKSNLFEVTNSFTSSRPNQLSVQKHEKLTVIMFYDRTGNSYWWWVANTKGKQGYVPQICLKKVFNTADDAQYMT